MQKRFTPLVVIISLSLLTFYGCKSDPVSTPVDPLSNYQKPFSTSGITILDAQYIDTTQLMSHIDKFAASPNYYLADFGNHVQNLPNVSGARIIWYCKISYTSTDNKGAPITLTGKLIYPYFPGKDITAPLISFQHATELMKKNAPSQWQINSNPGEFSEVTIAAGLAFKNSWAVILPDYQGMGDDTGEPHPLCNADRLGKSTADLIANMEAYLKSKSNNTNLVWNGQLFLMGFSEGGYATLATVKELEKRGGITITGAACMDAPLDITGAMIDVMLSDSPFGAPYFLPYLLRGYNSVYESSKVFNFDSILVAPYNKDLWTLADGFHTTAEVNAKMPSDKIVKKIFKQSTIDSMRTPNSSIWKILHENDIWNGWVPKSKIMIAHCMNDDLVPYGNYTKVKSVWSGQSNIEFFELGQCRNYLGSVHVSIAPWAFLQGTLWISEQVK